MGKYEELNKWNCIAMSRLLASWWWRLQSKKIVRLEAVYTLSPRSYKFTPQNKCL